MLFSINKNISFDEIAKYLEFVAISIVADIVPLNDENRITTIGRGGSDASAI